MSIKKDYNRKYASELIKYNSLQLKETPLTTSENIEWTSGSSGITYNSTAGELGLLTTLTSILKDTILTADDVNNKVNIEDFNNFNNQINDNLDNIQKNINKKINIDGGTFEGIIKAYSNASYSTKQVRNIILSNVEADVNNMDNGDIWIKYE